MAALTWDNFREQRRIFGRPFVVAHRGAQTVEPENTLRAFLLALAQGADALETDLHLTADGHVVASHDATLSRMAGVPVVIRRATLEELRRCDVGWGFVDRDGGRPFLGRGLRVPTLEELLDAFPGVSWNVDVKQRAPSMVGPAGVPSGFPHTPEGAVAQLAAIEVTVVEAMSIPTAHQVHAAWTLPGGVGAGEWAMRPQNMIRKSMAEESGVLNVVVEPPPTSCPSFRPF